VKQGGVGLADHLLGLISVEAARALVPELDVAFEIRADDRGLGRSLEHVADEVGGGVGVREECGIDKPPHASGRRWTRATALFVGEARARFHLLAARVAVGLDRPLYRQIISASRLRIPSGISPRTPRLRREFAGTP